MLELESALDSKSVSIFDISDPSTFLLVLHSIFSRVNLAPSKRETSTLGQQLGSSQKLDYRFKFGNTKKSPISIFFRFSKLNQLSNIDCGALIEVRLWLS